MENRDGKKPFTIPKTHASNKDLLISQKTDSRNVTELFDDLKSCALEANFDFRRSECKSCDSIRNQKLQKLYSERKNLMKKDQDPVERFAFHLIPSRDVGLNIANDGLSCEQLSFSLDKYLGNPKDGIHLSRRPDVLLVSASTQGLKKFGLLVCKILLGKGYTTIPSIQNKDLSAQLHHDHHFCKAQSSNKEQQRHIDNLLGNSLIFCYEHQDFHTVSHPSQVLPLAILWYDLTDKFSFKLSSSSSSSQEFQCNNEKKLKSNPKQLIKPLSKPVSLLNTGTWDDPTQNTDVTPATKAVLNTYPSQLISPCMSFYTSFSNVKQSTNSRDPRLIRTVSASETIPLSPKHSTPERIHSGITLLSKTLVHDSTTNSVHIPLNSTTQLDDPRSATLKTTQNIFYLELNAVIHAKQQQQRLNNYCTSNADLKPKTSYTLIPFLTRPISLNEPDSNNKTSKHSSLTNYSSLYVSVIDCFHFGFQKSSNQSFINLEENENRLAYEQLNISNELMEHKKQLSSKEIHLRIREKRQRKMQEYLWEQNRNYLTESKTFINIGRKLLKENQSGTSIPLTLLTNNRISLQLLDFFSYEYQHENRSNVKRLLAELMGVFVKKYGVESKQAAINEVQNRSTEGIIGDNRTINVIIDMELESTSIEALGDYDERFQIPIHPTSSQETFYNSAPVFPSLPLTETLSIAKNQASDQLENNPDKLADSTKIDASFTISNAPKESIHLMPNIELMETSTQEDSDLNNTCQSVIKNDEIKQIAKSKSFIDVEDDSNRSRDEFVKLLTKEVYTSKSPSLSHIHHNHRRSYEDEDINTDKNLSSSRKVILVSKNNENNLIIETTNIDQEKEDAENNDEPTIKRIKIDFNAPNVDDKSSPVTMVDCHDYRQDLDERKRQTEMDNKTRRSRSKSTSSRSSSVRECKTRSPSSSSSSRTSSVANRYQRRQRNNNRYDRNRSSDRTDCHHKKNMNSSTSNQSQLVSHQRFNYNHQSIADHPRFAHINTVSASEKNLNYYSFAASNYSSSSTGYHKTSGVNNTNRNSLIDNRCYSMSFHKCHRYVIENHLDDIKSNQIYVESSVKVKLMTVLCDN